MSKLNTSSILALATALNMPIQGKQVGCSGRKGVVYMRVEGHGPVSIARGKDGGPLVLDCEHEAIELIEEYVLAIAAAYKRGDVQGLHLPSQEDFFYSFVDQEREVEITDTSDADELIKHIKEMT